MIEIEHLSKRFGRRQAVDDLNIEVREGQIFGLLGHNGAGKSTALGMLLGHIFPDTGKIRVNGYDVATHRSQALAKTGALFETAAFYDYLSGWRNLKILSHYSGMTSDARIREVVELVGLSERIHDRVRVYSHGMRQRLALAQALLPEPRLLILDEPSDGLDPEGIREMRELIRRLNQQWGLTILFSSHMLGEVEQICTDIAIMREGKLLHTGPWLSDGPREQWHRLQCMHPNQQERAMNMLKTLGLIKQQREDDVLLSPGVLPGHINKTLFDHGIVLQHLAPHQESLEAFYLRVIRLHNRSEGGPGP